jgi:YegS/Rv2252/BmrU family lipid kinase
VTPGSTHLLLVNPSAGGGRVAELLPRAQAALESHGIDYRLVETTGIEHGLVEARMAAGAGEVVVVMSGDGLVGQVGGTLANTGAAFGVLPGGRGNDFARVLGIPTEVEGAVEVLAAGSLRDVDVGEVNGKRFLCIASLGFDSDANRIANEAKRIRGQAVYVYAAVRALWEWEPARFTLTFDDEAREDFTGFSVAAANSRAYGGGMFIAPDAELDDGKLDVVWTGDISKTKFLRNLPSVFKGTHVERPEVGTRRAASVKIEADRPFAVYADGDHLADLPATVRVLPKALRVIAPEGKPLVGPQ